MKTFFLALSFVAATLIGMGALANNGELPKIVHLSVDTATVPERVRSGEEVVTIVQGLYDNGCFRWLKGIVSESSNRIIEVRALASVSKGLCIAVQIPYRQKIVLGPFSSGEFLVRVVNPDGRSSDYPLRVE